jgi:hypothetical protein
MKREAAVEVERQAMGPIIPVGAPLSLRVAAIQGKLSTPARTATNVDAYRTLVLVGLARLEDTTARTRSSVRALRRLAAESPGPRAKDVNLGLDTTARQQVEAFRRRLSTKTRGVTTAAALRTLVLVGLDYAEKLPAEDLGLALVRFVQGTASRSSTRSACQDARG